MYTNTGYLYYKDIDLEDLSQPLIVENCGIYRLSKLSSMKTLRPYGRKDYQLIYVSSGKAHFYFNNEEKELQAGHFVLYRPGDSQHYIYYGNEQPEVYWTHFTGSEVAQILEYYGLFSDDCIHYTGTALEYAQIFRQIISEFQVRKPHFERLLVLLLEQLFLLIHRHTEENKHINNRLQKEIENAVLYFNENFYTTVNIGQYALSKHMSTCWFIRSFKQYTGMTPVQYITSLRLANAQSLLESTDYSVNEIAAIIGYDNPLYFSRIFKKHMGKAPSHYRKNLETVQ